MCFSSYIKNNDTKVELVVNALSRCLWKRVMGQVLFMRNMILLWKISEIKDIFNLFFF